MNKLIIALFLASAVVALDPADACLAYQKDQQGGNVDCLYCYGYNVRPGSPKCLSTSMPNCIFTVQLPGFPQTFCNICEKGYSLDMNNNAVCKAVATADIVENCDYYWIPQKMSNSKCIGCSKGFYAFFSKESTLDVSCVKNDPKMIANCDSMTVNEFQTSKHEVVVQANCQICAEGFTLYQTIKITGFLKDFVTSQCIPQTGHFQGCAVHNKEYNILGEVAASYCGMCDPRGGYKAHGEISKFKTGDKMCKKI